jgi:uncharacterized protein
MHHPFLLVLLTAASAYVAKLWRDDLRAAQTGRPNPRAFPGALPAARGVILIACGGAVLLVIVETFGEIALGITAEQSRLTWLFALYSVCGAPIIEELMFRGWLVVEHRGRPAMWAAAIIASALFALLHPFLWKWDDTGLVFLPGAKGWFSTVAIFVTSLWFYAVRLGPWNPTRSLLPCFVAHAAKNATVVTIKAATGFIGPLV